MDSFPFNRFGQYWRRANQWFYRTADRALDEAYKAALKIKAIEDEHFDGDTIAISPEYANNQVAAYFQNDLNKYLNIARIRLAEFQTSRAVTGNNYPQPPDSQQFENIKTGLGGRSANDINPYTSDIEYEARILEKLSFIDDILTRYADAPQIPLDQIDKLNPTLPNPRRSSFGQRAIDTIIPVEEFGLSLDRSQLDNQNDPANSLTSRSAPIENRRQARSPNPMSNRSRSEDNKKALIDPSLISTFRRIQQDLNPKAETQILEDYRFSQDKTRTALRFILMLILVPLLVHYISKIVMIGPAIEVYRSYHHSNNDVFLNVNLQQEAFDKIEMYEKNIKFKQLVGIAPKLTTEQIDAQIKTKAEEIKVDFYRQSAEAVKNWFADILSIVTFAWLITNSKRQIEVLKSFLDDLVSGLSDTAKAFMIILLTDTFVGFHSPHGWEVILHGLARHLGIAENNEFNSLFISTFPVLIDTVFKYWIFRYLTGQSPSSVATYKSMNE
jgi:CemA family